MITRTTVTLMASVFLGPGLSPQAAMAWDKQAHEAVGVLALELVLPATRRRLEQVLGSTDPWVIAYACYWPDEYEQTADGAWSSPLHYVNIAPEAVRYRKNRDCPDGKCLPEALAHYSRELKKQALDLQQRWEAFAFVCHLVADLHQPLHVAYADDRGGSLIDIRYQGQRLNLHEWWDGTALEQHSGSWQELVALLRKRPQQKRPQSWSTGDITPWINETLSFTRNFAYPEDYAIDPVFARRSWQVTQQQLDMAAGRLASVLDASMKNLTVIEEPAVSQPEDQPLTVREPPENPAEVP